MLGTADPEKKDHFHGSTLPSGALVQAMAGEISLILEEVEIRATEVAPACFSLL